MAKNKLLILAGGFINCLFHVAPAQPVLTSAGINPIAGDVYMIASGNYVSPGGAGASQTWDLSGIVASDTSLYTVGTVVSAPNYSLFSNNSNIQMNDGNSYSFFNIGSSVFQNSGLAVFYQGLYMAYSDNEDVLHFPMSFNDSFTDGWNATYTVSSASFTRTGSNQVSYDGYGTLILPTGTVTGAARIHLQEAYSDVSPFSNVNYTNDEYMWLINSVHQPVARLSTLTASSPSSTAQWGYYMIPYNLPTALATNQRDPASEFLLFPNPASELIQVTLRQPGAAIQAVALIDPLGNVVYNEDFSTCLKNAVTIKTNDLATGIYTVRVSTQNGYVEAKKISLTQ